MDLKRLKSRKELSIPVKIYPKKKRTSYSFLVKQGSTEFMVREEKKVVKDNGVTILELHGGPVVKPIPKIRRKNPPPPRQATVNLSKKGWKNLIDAYQVKDSNVPHREGSIYLRKEDLNKVTLLL